MMAMGGAFLPPAEEDVEPNVLIVGEGFFPTIQSAIDAANDGDHVKLTPGVYSDPIDVNKPITIWGCGPDALITTTMEISSNGISVTGHTFRGIYNNATSHNWDFGGIITRQKMGSISDSYISGLSVTRCTFTNCRQGIFLFGAKSSTVDTCTFTGCYRGITINPHRIGNRIYWNSYSNTIKNCNFYNCVGTGIDDGEAIAIFDSNNNVIDNCYMEGNSYGVAITRGAGNQIKNCDIKDSTYNPIFLDSVSGTNSVTMTSNTITNNADGVLIKSSNRFNFNSNTLRGNGGPINIYRSTIFNFNGNTINGSVVLLNESSNGAFNTNTFEISPVQTFIFLGSQGHYNHNIASTNTVSGKPIYYYYNNNAVNLADADAGAILLAYSPNARVTNAKVTDGDGVWLWNSDGGSLEVDVKNCIYGVTMAYCDAVDLNGCSVNTSTRGLRGINAFTTTDSSARDGVIAAPGPVPAILLEGDSDLTTYNITFDYSDIEVTQNSGGNLHVYHYLDIMVWDNGTIDPLEYVEIEVSTDDTPVYATPHYGGTDATTDAGGEALDIPLLNREYLKSNTATMHVNDVLVYREIDAVWTDGATDIDMSGPLTLVFEASDIRAPMTPDGFMVTDVPAEDAIEVSWDANIDDTLIYNVYWNDTGVWTALGNTALTDFTVRDGLVHNTEYWFAASAFDEVPLESIWTDKMKVLHMDGLAPEAPTGLVATDIQGLEISMEWVANLEVDIEGYSIYVNDTGGGSEGPWVLLAEGLTSLEYTAMGLASETTYYFVVTAFDEVPNESPKSIALEARTLDITPPNAPTLDVLPPFTNMDPYVITGMAEPDSTVTIFVGGDEVATGTAEADGSFSISTDLNDGLNVITAWATDISLNTGPLSDEGQITLDIVAPPMPVLDELPELTNVVEWEISGTVEGLSTVTVVLNGETVLTFATEEDGTFSVTVELVEGENTISAMATDRAFNAGPAAEVIVVLDTIAPDAPEAEEAPEYTNEDEVTITGTAEIGALVAILAGGDVLGEGVADGDGEWSIEITLEEGENEIVLRATDLAGNEGDESDVITIILDKVAPTPDAGPDASYIEGDQATFDGSASTDNEGIANWTWTFTWGGTDEELDGETATFTFGTTGGVTVTLTVTDLAGNTAIDEVVLAIEVDNQAPTLKQGDLGPGSGTVDTEWTFEVVFTDPDGDGGEVEVWIDGNAYLMTADPDDTDSTDGMIYTYTTKLETGEHSYYFTGEDDQGAEAGGPSAGEGNAYSTPDVSEKSTEGTPGPGVVMALVAVVVALVAVRVRRRRE